MKRLHAFFEATIGRSLLSRIWGHSLSLFVGVIGLLFVGRFMPRALPLPTAYAYILHIALLALTALLIAYASALPLARRIARPLAELGTLARALGQGDLAVRAPAEGRDEIGDLARSFNRMASDIQRLRSAERQLLADVSHELRTPLARMRVVLDLAADADPVETRRYVREIATDLSELEELLGDIIVSSRLDPDATHWTEARPPLRRALVDLHDVVGAVAERFRSRFAARVLVCDLPDEPLAVDADPALLRRALENLIDNARKYSPDEAPIDLAVTREGGELTIAVVDRGIGISAEDQPLLMTPFFRADRSRSRATGGVGLGLLLARRIAEAHGGRLSFSSEPGRGSRFCLTLSASPR